jgi:hypothetical protein
MENPWIEKTERFTSLSELFDNYKDIIRLGNVEEMNLDTLQSLYFLNSGLYELLDSNNLKSIPTKLNLYRLQKTLMNEKVFSKIKEIIGFNDIQNQLTREYPESEWQLITKSDNNDANSESEDTAKEFYAARNTQIHNQLAKITQEQTELYHKLASGDEDKNCLVLQYLKDIEYLEEILELFKNDTHSLNFTTKGWQKLATSLRKLYEFLNMPVSVTFKQANHKGGSSHTHIMQINNTVQPVKTINKNAQIDGTSILALKRTLCHEENIPGLVAKARNMIEENMAEINNQNIMEDIRSSNTKYV